MVLTAIDQIVSEWTPLCVILSAYLLGNYFQLRRIARFHCRIDEFRDSMNKGFDDLHDLLKSEIKRVEERLEPLEHPIVRQS